MCVFIETNGAVCVCVLLSLSLKVIVGNLDGLSEPNKRRLVSTNALQKFAGQMGLACFETVVASKPRPASGAPDCVNDILSTLVRQCLVATSSSTANANAGANGSANASQNQIQREGLELTAGGGSRKKASCCGGR